jgi:hypothetical protein
MAFASDCRAALCEMIGTPRKHFQTFDIRQSSIGPTIAINGDEATLLVAPNVTSCESTLVSNVAHESVHLHLTDGGYGNASGLEEGFALHFELSMVEQHYGVPERERHIAHLPATYSTALRDYDYLLTISEDPALRVLKSHGMLTGVSWGEVRRLFPRVGWRMSYRLARRRRMRVG